MLRAIYAFHLFFFGAFVFLIGLILIPFGYAATLFARIRLILRESWILNKREWFMAKTALRSKPERILRRHLLKLLIFILIGVFQLVLRNFTDTLSFVRDCWREQSPSLLSELNSNRKH